MAISKLQMFLKILWCSIYAEVLVSTLRFALPLKRIMIGVIRFTVIERYGVSLSLPSPHSPSIVPFLLYRIFYSYPAPVALVTPLKLRESMDGGNHLLSGGAQACLSLENAI
ncbi:hypothetical protein EVAR_96983_1 [Eumeta japonica]|uniref:Uncharacterized protein n=1 Tax=Eumeta variegata TaxID=151549 RepID=A0A4C1VEF3_EUMVA|nr:hypothetical protein EVAR_96983_1 [Eumeta japonica]